MTIKISGFQPLRELRSKTSNVPENTLRHPLKKSFPMGNLIKTTLKLEKLDKEQSERQKLSMQSQLENAVAKEIPNDKPFNPSIRLKA